MTKQLPDQMNDIILEVASKFGKESKTTELFKKCFTNTLDTTIEMREDGTAYVITGDIPAMWLRDSTAQIRPYLLLAGKNEKIADVIAGLVKSQMQYILTDPYANAFNESPNGACWRVDETEHNDWVWERKYEIDSLCYPVQLAYLLWKNTGKTEHFNDLFQEGVKKIMEVFRTEQHHEEASSYRFQRKNTFYRDTLSRDGKGALVKSGIGMTWSGFRPSDDACTYGYLIPSNMFAVVILGYLSEIADHVVCVRPLKQEADKLRAEIYEGIENFGITETEEFGRVYAYETDGFGQYNLMDDANVPSLLSMSYLGYKGKDESVAANTRRLILSEANPYYFKGDAAAGIGSSHTNSRYIWHIALAMQGLTSEHEAQRREMIHILSSTDGGKHLMHEGFHADDPSVYTREWFSWANALFCELVLEVCGYHFIR